MIRRGIYFVKRSVVNENGDIRVSKLCVAGKWARNYKFNPEKQEHNSFVIYLIHWSREDMEVVRTVVTEQRKLGSRVIEYRFPKNGLNEDLVLLGT